MKEISGFAHRQPNLDFANKARLLPPSPLCLTDSDICMLFEEATALIRKPKPGGKKGGIAEASDWRDGISGKLREREEERGAFG